MALQYTPTEWVDGKNGGTAITAARLNNIETGVAGTVSQANESAAKVAALEKSASALMVKRIVSDAQAMAKGSIYGVMAEIPTVPGASPFGIVGVTSDHDSSIDVMAFSVSANKRNAFARVSCIYPQNSIVFYFDVLYLPTQAS